MLATALTPVLVLAPLSLAGECDVPINEDCDGAILFDNDDLPYSFSGMLGCGGITSEECKQCETNLQNQSKAPLLCSPMALVSPVFWPAARICCCSCVPGWSTPTW